MKGGSETYYFGLAELLRKQGHEVIFFSMKDERNVPCEQEKYFVENVDFNAPMSKLQMVKAGLKMLYSFEAKKKLEKLIIDEKPDIAHLNIFQSQLTGSIVDVLYKNHIPMVYTMHDLKVLCPCYTMLSHGKICEKCVSGNFWHCVRNRCMKDSLLKSILAAIESRIYRLNKTYRKLDLIITPSAFYKAKLENAKITNSPIEHLRNFLPVGTEYAKDIEVGDYYLYFGRLSKEKGVLSLIKAYKKANIANPLYLVGTGPIENEIKELIKNTYLEDKVCLLGYKTGKELMDIVKKSRCVVLPSEWYENGPYSLMEAQAVGKLCLVSNNGGLKEVVEDGVSGYVFNYEEKGMLTNCLRKIELLSENEIISFGTKAMAECKKRHNSEKYKDKVLGFYESLCSKKRIKGAGCHNYGQYLS